VAALDSLLVRLCRSSSRVYANANFVAQSGGLRLPISRSLGLGLLQPIDQTFEALLRHLYSDGLRRDFVDVGANIGRILLTLNRVDSEIAYIGFEPSTRAADLAREVIELNGLGRSHAIVPIALSDRYGFAELRFGSPGDVSASLNLSVRPSSMYARGCVVPTAPGDPFLADRERIGVIKIDAEGAEPQVIRGLRNTIARCRPAIIMEVLPFTHLEDGTYSKSYFGELSEETRKSLVASRKAHIEVLESIAAQEIEYSFFRFRVNRLSPSSPWTTAKGDYDFVLIPKERSVLA
jgi:FkbM family methyltransferase